MTDMSNNWNVNTFDTVWTCCVPTKIVKRLKKVTITIQLNLKIEKQYLQISSTILAEKESGIYH